MANIDFTGRLTGDPEVKFLPSGQAVANFTVAENHQRKVGSEWQDDGATFYRVAVFGKAAENVAEQLSKGTPVLVKGRFKTREYESRDGGKGLSLDVVADAVGVIARGESRPAARLVAADPWGSEQPAAVVPF